MAKKGLKVETPPKKFAIPADIKALQGYGKIIIDAIYAEFAKRRSPK